MEDDNNKLRSSNERKNKNNHTGQVKMAISAARPACNVNLHNRNC